MKNQIAKIRTITSLAQAYGFLTGQEGERMALIYGDPGLGKTKAAEFLAKQYQALYCQCRPSWTPFGMIKTLLATSNLTARGTDEGLNLLIEDLSTARRALILDDINLLFHNKAKVDTLLETIRTIHDIAQCPVLLIGMTGIYGQIKHLKQFHDRISYFLEVKPCSLADTRQLADSLSEVYIENDLLEDIFTKGQGNVREIKNSIAHAERTAIINGWEAINLKQWGTNDYHHANALPTQRKTRKAVAA